MAIPTLPIDRLLISPTGFAHVPGGCIHYVEDPAAAGWGWIPSPLLSLWASVDADRPARATAGNTARVATKRCRDCVAFLSR
ncbi:hypothetical protein GR925_38820 [Streptomyces sp. HUCO-GS316]|uniref:hypothetical protein n=1 Tax=Streptomyces sp. HUCO-GS316 TaxID=2692198 RepID=UPI00136FA68A|nr:hypothetical protein [Streptomyces sp. HUCO-GS316]MXM69188.1 hypothetical protein [Streptomyces sp. HUCO-GS316]